MGIGRRTKIITEYRQDADGEGNSIVGIGAKYFTVSSSS